MRPKPSPLAPTGGCGGPISLSLLVALLWLGLLIPDLTWADDNSEKLEQLRRQIHSLRKELDSDVQRKQGLQTRLRRTEQHIGKVVALLKRLKQQLRTQQRELKKLQARRRGLQSDLHTQRVALARQLRAAYAIGQQEYLKILLNQQDPSVVTRTLTYYDYFHRARLARMQDINDNLADLREIAATIQRKTTSLNKTRAEQQSEKAQLEKTRQKRAQLLASLQRQIHAKGERLSHLQEDERRLQRLLDSLATTTRPPLQTEETDPSLSFGSGEHIPFAKRRGRLSWPTHGRLSTRYGSRRKVGKLKWQGVNITAPEGTEVRAISHGRVAFSDWLRGFGLLLIIDHGDGYMSLYGGNQSLFKEVGDWVESGEVVASVGNSGGRQQSALYFEIRHNGKPINPLKWCRNKPKQVKQAS